jgi:hypothetical protein
MWLGKTLGFDRDKIVSKLDSTLLFFASSVNLAFGLGYAIVAFEWLKIFVPFLIIAWIIPIYVGYIRGALIQDSIDERIRGWIYFASGTAYYAYFLTMFILLITTMNLSIYFAAMIAIIFTRLIKIEFWSVIVYDLFKVRHENFNMSVSRAIVSTEFSALSLSMGMAIVGMLWSNLIPIPQFYLFLISTIIVLVIAVFVVKFELKARAELRKGRLNALFKMQQQ